MTNSAKKKSENKVSFEAPEKASKEINVIGIGASAGGLQALDAFFSKVPLDNVAYVIVQHLSSDHCSLLTELLAQHSVLQVIEAKHNAPVEANKVYVIPSDKELIIRDNRLQLRNKTAWGRPRTIDIFFKSLAADKGYRAIGIILSGTGTDGTEGVVAIKKAGGMVIVQDPTTARFDGMPLNAINTGYADFVIAPELMPHEIFNYVKVTPLENEVTELVNTETESSFYLILDMIHDRTGLDFSNYKRPTIIRRISRRMALTNNASLVDYLDYLNLHAAEIENLSKEFLIGVTKFFRDKEAYELLGNKVIAAIIDGKINTDQVRVWVAGCSTGEEAYSIAILISEYMIKVKKELEVKIFASDIDREALETAGKGLYPLSCLSEVSPDRLNDFFVKEDGKYRVSQRIRRMVIFAPHNVINDPPFSKIDLVSCRNMLIYLNPLLQKKVIDKFHYALQMGGYLFLGSSESIGDVKGFSEVNKKWKIFRNTEPARGLMGMESYSESGLTRKSAITKVAGYGREILPKEIQQHNFTELLNDTILEEYHYAAVFIDDHYDILHGVGKFKNYLSLPEQNFTINLLKLVPPDLSVNLGTMLHKVMRDKVKVAVRGIQVREGHNLRSINVVVKPYFADKKLYQKFILVLFSEEQPPVPLEERPVPVESETRYERQIKELELELQHTKEDLQAVVEELETANEELQSTNEELLSSNEELQSTNEELQSLNEELHTINAEHQYKIKVLVELDNDLNNYFRSTDIGQLFIDSKLLIRKFTPAATRLINLIESDIGRSIFHISNNLLHVDLVDDIRHVVASAKTIEREVQDKNGIWYQMRILPYITQERKIDGAIVIFIRINELKNLQLMQAGIFDSSPNILVVLKAIRDNHQAITDFRLNLINNKGLELLDIPEMELRDKPVRKTIPNILSPDLFGKFVQVVETGEQFETEQLQTYAGKRYWMRIAAVKLDDGLVLNMRNISEQKHYEQELQKQKSSIQLISERFRMMFEAIPHIAWTHLPNGDIESYNQRWQEYTGFTPKEARDFRWLKIIHPDDRRKLKNELKKSFSNGIMLNTQIRLRRHSDGRYCWQIVQLVPTRNKDGEIKLWIGTATDIQEQKETEAVHIQLRLSQQREIMNAIIQTQEDEREHISEALHNGIGQILYAAKLNVHNIEAVNAEQKKTNDRIENLLNEGIKITRNISYELTPGILKDFGLQTAVKDMVSRISNPNLMLNLQIKGLEKRLDYLKEISLYRIIQELLNNIIKHAKATKATVKLDCDKNKITIRIQDNGIGFIKDDLHKTKGIGLRSVLNRIELMDGKIEVTTAPGSGTQIKIRCSLHNGWGTSR